MSEGKEGGYQPSEEEIKLAEEHMSGDHDAEKISAMSETREDTLAYSQGLQAIENENRSKEVARENFEKDFFGATQERLFFDGSYEKEARKLLVKEFGEDYAAVVYKPSFHIDEQTLHPFTDHQEEETRVTLVVFDDQDKSHRIDLKTRVRKLTKAEMQRSKELDDRFN